MTTHTNCSHEPTKAARAMCRKAKAARPTVPHIDACDDCGAQHEAEKAHTDRFSGAQLYVVVCEGYFEYYTEARVIFP